MLRSEISRKNHGRFQNYYWEGNIDECWNWLGGLHKTSGKGTFWLNGTSEYASRVAYLLEFGDFDQDLNVCHTCDNPRCINPHHLFLGTQKDNVHDMLKKGRSPFIGSILTGEEHHNTKIDDTTMLEIVELYKSGAFTQRQLARQFGISKTIVGNYTRGYRSNNK